MMVFRPSIDIHFRYVIYFNPMMSESMEVGRLGIMSADRVDYGQLHQVLYAVT